MKIVALAGGVGGAKLVDGLTQIMSPDDLSIIVNTGDDFEHIGLTICPDIDTICYTLANLAHPETGWGRKDETYRALESIIDLGGPSWFRLGDRDLATHLERTRRLKEGQNLSQITYSFCQSWKVPFRVFPMSNQPVRTMVNTIEHGELPFQEYFVYYFCEPKVKGFRFVGAESASPSPGVKEAISLADAVVICPSNPWVSIDPILAIQEIQTSLVGKTVVAVSPIIGGRTVKGPAAKMFTEMGIKPTPFSVAHHYGNILSGFVMDNLDLGIKDDFWLPVLVTNTLMKTRSDRRKLAVLVLKFVKSLCITSN
jgi:LPPG:FO 2-phospho-L-lactate transferase